MVVLRKLNLPLCAQLKPPPFFCSSLKRQRPPLQFSFFCSSPIDPLLVLPSDASAALDNARRAVGSSSSRVVLLPRSVCQSRAARSPSCFGRGPAPLSCTPRGHGSCNVTYDLSYLSLLCLYYNNKNVICAVEIILY